MLWDMTGKVARTFGVVDTTTHLAYSAMFLMDMDGVVQAVKVTGRGGLGMKGVWEVFNLVRDSFVVEEAEVTSDEYLDLFTRCNKTVCLCLMYK